MSRARGSRSGPDDSRCVSAQRQSGVSLTLAVSQIRKLGMVIAHHLIWVAYGWWLGNDPRGSMSKWIRSDLISELGELHYGRKRMQPKGIVIREFYHRAKDVLKFPLLTFTPEDVRIIAKAIAR